MKIVTDENSERVARYAFEYGNFLSLNLQWFNLNLKMVQCSI